jgi:phage-related protein
MKMFDQLIIGDIHSYDDFDATVAERKVGKPKKKIVKETVPYSNITHDFSAINGEIYWEERELEYVFEIIADSAEELEEKKRPFMSWIMNVMNEKLHDPFIPDYHFLATFADIDEDDSEIEKSTITVKFTAYPYMIANEQREYSVTLTHDLGEDDETVTLKILNESSHIIVPTVISDGVCTVEIPRNKGVRYSILAGERVDETFTLDIGENVWTIVASLFSGKLTVRFNEEVF